MRRSLIKLLYSHPPLPDRKCTSTLATLSLEPSLLTPGTLPSSEGIEVLYCASQPYLQQSQEAAGLLLGWNADRPCQTLGPIARNNLFLPKERWIPGGGFYWTPGVGKTDWVDVELNGGGGDENLALVVL